MMRSRPGPTASRRMPRTSTPKVEGVRPRVTERAVPLIPVATWSSGRIDGHSPVRLPGVWPVAGADPPRRNHDRQGQKARDRPSHAPYGHILALPPMARRPPPAQTAGTLSMGFWPQMPSPSGHFLDEWMGRDVRLGECRG